VKHTITEVIAEFRLKYIQEFLDFFYTQVTDRAARLGNAPPPAHACKHSNGALCDATILGNIWRGILRHGREGLFPKKAEEIPEESILSLCGVLEELFKMPQQGQGDPAGYHEECSPERAFEEMKNRVMGPCGEWRSLIRDRDKEYMARRRSLLQVSIW
jgi:hypothetical protein